MVPFCNLSVRTIRYTDGGYNYAIIFYLSISEKGHKATNMLLKDSVYRLYALNNI